MDYQHMIHELNDLRLLFYQQLIPFFSTSAHASEDRVLLYLYLYQNPSFPQNIAKELRITTGRATNVLNSLERKGYISRQQHEHDRRRVYISLTDEGRSYVDGLHKIFLQRQLSILTQLGEADSIELIRLLKRVAELTQISSV